MLKYAIATLLLLYTSIPSVLAEPQGSISGAIEWSKGDGQPAGRSSTRISTTINTGAAICKRFQLFITAGKSPIPIGSFAPNSGARLGNQPQFAYVDSGDRHSCTYQFTELPEGTKLTVNLEAPANWQYPDTAPPNAKMSFIPVNDAQIVLQRDNIDAPAAAVVNFSGSLSATVLN